MSKLRFLSSGESHGRALTGIIEGIPAGLSITNGDIDRELIRRQGGYGRGGRMKIESDRVQILSGVRHGRTLGSPIGILIQNLDWQNWKDVMSPKPGMVSQERTVTAPRPGHADLAGTIKFAHRDIRNVLERSSARETAIRTALGAIAKKFLSEFGIHIGSHVVSIGSVASPERGGAIRDEDLLRIFRKAEKSPVRCADPGATKRMVRLIDRAKREGNSLGGVFEVFAVGLPVGIGSHTQWDRRLDGEIARAMMGIQAVKGVELGGGFGMAAMFGSDVQDEIFYRKSRGDRVKGHSTGFYRKTNHAGGIEGGMTNGMPLLARVAMKPIPTQRRPLRSVDIRTKKSLEAAYERSDTCAVPAAAVIGEAMIALVITDAFLGKFGGDSMKETGRNYRGYQKQIREF
jgi:chorismate synthase